MKIDKNNKFALNTTWLVIGRAVQIGLTFIMALLVPRYLGPSDYGAIQYTYSFVAILVPVANLGLNEIIVKELVDNKDKNDEIIGTVIVIKLIGAIVSTILLYLIIQVMGMDSKSIIITLLQALTLLFQSFECITYFYQSKLLSSKPAIINVITYVATTIFRVVGLMINKDVKWFAFAVSLDHIVLALLLLCCYLYEGHKICFSKDTGIKLLSKSKNYLFASLMIVIYDQTNKLLLGYFFDDTAVGLLSAATQLCNAWPFVLTAIIDSASPIIIDLFQKDKELFNKRLKQLYASIFYIGLLVALVFTLFSKPIIGIIYGPAYAGSSIPLKIVSWSTIFAYFGVSRSIWMQCNNKLKYEKNISVVGAVSNVVLNLILITIFGINGAAIALTLTQFITNFVMVYIIKDTRENALLLVDAIRLKGVL